MYYFTIPILMKEFKPYFQVTNHQGKKRENLKVNKNQEIFFLSKLTEKLALLEMMTDEHIDN